MQPIHLAINWDVVLDGLLISVVGYTVVLLALAALYYVFRYLPRLLHLRARLRLRREGKQSHEGEELFIGGDVSAAIATALYLYLHEVHDEENVTMTIKKVSRAYSPWSSKIFGVTNRLRR